MTDKYTPKVGDKISLQYYDDGIVWDYGNATVMYVSSNYLVFTDKTGTAEYSIPIDSIGRIEPYMTPEQKAEQAKIDLIINILKECSANKVGYGTMAYNIYRELFEVVNDK